MAFQRLIFLLITIHIISPSRGQINFHYSEASVLENGRELSMPWVGGLNSVQYNDIDLNEDSQPDLVLFDRSTNKLLTFLWKNDDYSYHPEYESRFPGDLVSWMLLRDYDCDGDKDLFTDSQLGFRVFENIGNNSPEWELAVDPIRTLGSQMINLLFNDSDIPAIEDLDGDGDLDVLAFNFATGLNIDFHQNMSVENTGSCGIDFVRITRTYGDIFECDCGDLRFNAPCPINGRTKHSGGKAILAIDLDNDNDYELLTGEEECEELTFLNNEGDNQNASFSQFSDFFEAFDTELFFPASYSIDLNNDQILDLAISTNQRTNDLGLVDLEESSYFLQNIGSNEAPIYELVQPDFLQDRMIDVGEESKPAFFDFDGDGDQDLFLSSVRMQEDGRSLGVISLYENTGDVNDPGFTLITNDYLGLSSLSFNNIHSQFVDINTDGDDDLVINVSEPGNLGSRLVWFENNGSSEIFDIDNLRELSDLSVLADYPWLVDINLDGVLDLLIGRRIGTLEFYRNDGTNEFPEFILDDPNFLSINTSIERINVVPAISDLRGDGIIDLITTDASGELSIYQDFLNNPTLEREVLIDPLTGNLTATDFGRLSWPAVTDLYGLGSVDLFVGTVAGGLFHLSDTTTRSTVIDPEDVSLEVFPNPSISNSSISIRSNTAGTIEIFNISGQVIQDQRRILANQTYQLDPTLYPNGVYVVRFMSNDLRRTKRFIIGN